GDPRHDVEGRETRPYRPRKPVLVGQAFSLTARRCGPPSVGHAAGEPFWHFCQAESLTYAERRRLNSSNAQASSPAEAGSGTAATPAAVGHMRPKFSFQIARSSASTTLLSEPSAASSVVEPNARCQARKSAPSTMLSRLKSPG